MHDKKLFLLAGVILVLPLTLAFFGHDQFRYPCQVPTNWDSEQCKYPICDVTRTCPEHIFKGQRDPRLGPPKDEPNKTITPAPGMGFGPTTQGANCGK